LSGAHEIGVHGGGQPLLVAHTTMLSDDHNRMHSIGGSKLPYPRRCWTCLSKD
jgi:hypothetical protein